MQAASPSSLVYIIKLIYDGFPFFLVFSFLERTQHYPTLDTSTYIGSYIYRYLSTLG